MRRACVYAAPRLAVPQRFIASFKYINLKNFLRENQRLNQNIHQYTKKLIYKKLKGYW